MRRFQEMMERIEDQVVQYLYRVELVQAQPERRRQVQRTTAGPPTTVRRSTPTVVRNDLFPCGFGKRYKKCHGAMEGAGA